MTDRFQHVTRQELYEKVWAEPMTKVAEHFGLSDHGLANLCSRHNIPKPPRGYWAKLAAGKPSPQTPLLDPNDGDRTITITRTLEPPMPVAATRDIKNADPEPVVIPETMSGLHPIVRGWVNDHKEEQARLRREAKGRDPVFRTAAWQRADLTERDQYRFRVTSAFFKELDRKGIPISDAHVNGRFKLTISGETVNGTVVERMHKAYTADVEPWTAWPEHHAGRLKPSGFLRLKIEAPWAIQMELVESEARKASTLIPQLMLFADALEPRLREKQAEQRQWQEEYEARKQEEERRAREARQEEERWQQFRSKAGDFEEVQRLRAFIAALRSSCNETGEDIDGKSMEEWLAWAEERATELDPLTDPTQVFKRPSRTGGGEFSLHQCEPPENCARASGRISHSE
ncbi:hypothetical protein [Sagittula sp. SSi028]|uniref:hypothetical protein n=1 Tax=Sagittula sp. SSi028 TaxID=3400636 RepID=UPI003AF89D02